MHNHHIYKHIYKFFVFFGLMAALGCTGSKSKSDAANDEAPEVEFVEARVTKVQTSMEILGRVRAYKIAQIRPQVNGIVLDRLFSEGSYVDKGQPLYQIDPVMLDSRRSLYEAQRNLIELQKSFFNNYAFLFKALGGGA